MAAALVVLASACGGPAPAAASTETPPLGLATATSTPVTPRTTPPGTPAPIPSEVTIASVPLDPRSTPPDATPTPTPQPGLWRIQGSVVDEDGRPLGSVCVVVGPHGCKPFSPHTDERGHWFLDIAEGTSTFDFYFELPGRQTVWWQVTPAGPIEHNVILRKS